MSASVHAIRAGRGCCRVEGAGRICSEVAAAAWNVALRTRKRRRLYPLWTAATRDGALRQRRPRRIDTGRALLLAVWQEGHHPRHPALGHRPPHARVRQLQGWLCRKLRRPLRGHDGCLDGCWACLHRHVLLVFSCLLPLHLPPPSSCFHNVKKKVSHACRANKKIFINGGLVDLQVYKLIDTSAVGEAVDNLLLNFPSIDAIDHVDPQSVHHVVQLCGVDATTGLEHLPADKRSLSTVATAFWMEQTRRYILVFASKTWSLLRRVEEAARIAVFLRILRQHVRESQNLNLEANFLCPQTYWHLLLSLHSVRSFKSCHAWLLSSRGPAAGGGRVRVRVVLVLYVLRTLLTMAATATIARPPGCPTHSGSRSSWKEGQAQPRPPWLRHLRGLLQASHVFFRFPCLLRSVCDLCYLSIDLPPRSPLTLLLATTAKSFICLHSVVHFSSHVVLLGSPFLPANCQAC
jgi:hypothetical protein